MTLGIITLIIGLLISLIGCVYFRFNQTRIGTQRGALAALTGLAIIFIGIYGIGIERAGTQVVDRPNACEDGSMPWDNSGRPTCLTPEERELRGAWQAKVMERLLKQRNK